MKCQSCGVEGRISHIEELDGVDRLHWVCGNPRCAGYKQEIGTNDVPEKKEN